MTHKLVTQEVSKRSDSTTVDVIMAEELRKIPTVRLDQVVQK
ncbi:hypothetical protein [uncultured Pontibacter sp.]|nr:hypothetical protein [uncultured Pontibacter sp.]